MGDQGAAVGCGQTAVTLDAGDVAMDCMLVMDKGKSSVLSGEAARASRIHSQNHLALMLAKRLCVAVLRLWKAAINPGPATGGGRCKETGTSPKRLKKHG